MLTIIFVMLAEVMIFVPSIARFRHDYLSERLERAQLASLSQLAAEGQMVDQDLAEELLRNAEVQTIALRRDEIRELILASDALGMVDATFDLRDASAWGLMRDALQSLISEPDRTIRIIGTPVKSGGLSIEATLSEAPLRAAMVEYGQNVFFLSLLISVITAALLFMAVRRFIVRPISRVVTSITAFRNNPEDAHGIIIPDAGVRELRDAEVALQDMQSRIASSLKQRERLVQLGSAVAKVSHDLRNMLTTAQIWADRMETSEDPLVARAAPKLINSLNRAINLCEQTLEFGKAEEPKPRITRVDLNIVVQDVLDSEHLRRNGDAWSIAADIPPGMTIEADGEQVFRILINLARNARQAIANSGRRGAVHIRAEAAGEAVLIDVSDTGPGLPKRALDNLFKPFEGGTRREGSGLGLAIAAELVRGHGGKLELTKTGPEGTEFRITLPHGLPEVAANPKITRLKGATP